MTASIIYKGSLRCLAQHNQSGSYIETDAPTDNRGKGERFSPTDLVCVALATCIVTTMAMKASDMQISVDESNVEVQKHMLSDPRRIGKIEIWINMTAQVDEKTKTILERIAHTCPVAKSLASDLEVIVQFTWPS